MTSRKKPAKVDERVTVCRVFKVHFLPGPDEVKVLGTGASLQSRIRQKATERNNAGLAQVTGDRGKRVAQVSVEFDAEGSLLYGGFHMA